MKHLVTLGAGTAGTIVANRMARETEADWTITVIDPAETHLYQPGLLGPEWHESIHDFYTLEGAQALRERLATFDRGRLVLNVVEMPIKCPVAPLEFLFLADEFFTKKGVRDQVELVLATPRDGTFTKPVCNSVLSYLIDQKGIRIEC